MCTSHVQVTLIIVSWNPEIRDTTKGFHSQVAQTFASGMCHNCFFCRDNKVRDDKNI